MDLASPAVSGTSVYANGLNAELNSICHLLALLGAHHILHVSRKRIKNVKKSVWGSHNYVGKDPSLMRLLRRIGWYTVNDVSKDRSTFIFRGKQQVFVECQP